MTEIRKSKISDAAESKKQKDSVGKEIGKVSGYFSHVEVAAIKLSGNMNIGDRIHIKGHTTDFETEVESIQIKNKSVKSAKKGDHIGIKIPEKVRPNDTVFLIK